jgi:hypothetical protein
VKIRHNPDAELLELMRRCGWMGTQNWVLNVDCAGAKEVGQIALKLSPGGLEGPGEWSRIKLQRRKRVENGMKVAPLEGMPAVDEEVVDCHHGQNWP